MRLRWFFPLILLTFFTLTAQTHAQTANLREVHAEGLKFAGVTLRWRERDERAALVFDDVRDLALTGVQVMSADAAPVIVLNDVHGAALSACRPPQGTQEFLRVQGVCTGIATP